MGGEYLVANESETPLRLVQSQWEGATVIGGVTQNPEIKSIEAVWEDGKHTIIEVVDNTFLFVREDGMQLDWIVGLNNESERVSNSTTFAEYSPQLFQYEQTRWITIDEGVIVLGSYNLQPDKTCIEIRLLTSENAQKRIVGEEALIKQVGCQTLEHNQAVGSPVSTVIDNSTSISATLIAI